MMNKNEDVRKLISIKEITDIRPIKWANKLELAIVGGWQVMVPKGEHKVGDKVVFFEIDTFLPCGIEEFKFLTEKENRTVTAPNGEKVRGTVITSKKVRDITIQGLAMKPTAFKGLTNEADIEDFFKEMGVFKFEKVFATECNVIGEFPAFTLKTDSERVQNLTNEILKTLKRNATWVATEKVDGTSTTWWKDENNNLRLANRNFEIEIKPNTSFDKIAKDLDLQNLLQPGDVLKAELVGEKIQSNTLKLQGQKLIIFEWESTRPMPEILKQHVTPVIDIEFPETVEQAIAQVDGMMSCVNPNVQAEGIVWWNKEKKEFAELGFRPNFKAINNQLINDTRD